MTVRQLGRAIKEECSDAVEWLGHSCALKQVVVGSFGTTNTGKKIGWEKASNVIIVSFSGKHCWVS